MISEEFGITGWVLKERSIVKEDIVEVLDYLKPQFSSKKVTIFMDNLRSHKTKAVVGKIEE